MSPRGVGVVYVGGWGRSGSTLLAVLLGQVPGFVAVGEVREIWRRGLSEDGACGCGQPFHACDFWTKVGQRAFGGWDRVDLDSVSRARYAVDRGWMTPLLAIPGGPFAHRRLVPGYLEALERLYRAIAEVSGARWVVDTSKLPSHALLLDRLPSLDVRILHLVRDSRGVATSWRTRIEASQGSGRELLRYGPVGSAIRYDFYNSATSALRHLMPYRRMRYEDAVRDPGAALSRCLAFVDEERQDALAFLGPEGATIAPTHTVDGNPMRFVEGPLRIQPDESWHERMPERERRLVTALTWPWLWSYGYRSPR